MNLRLVSVRSTFQVFVYRNVYLTDIYLCSPIKFDFTNAKSFLFSDMSESWQVGLQVV